MQMDLALKLLVTCALAAVFPIYSAVVRKKKQAELREKKLMLDYPLIVRKLVLLLGAGLSCRMAIRKIALEYREKVKNGVPRREGFEEILTLFQEMNRGVLEEEAYRHLGQRTGCRAYKIFSMLLVQNLKKGSRTLLTVLDEEAKDAGRRRRKRARILGEEASAKLLFPMLMMLGIVLVILVVPAFMTLL